MSFKYEIGDAVEYKPLGGSIGLFRVVQRMPEEDAAFDRKYRIRSEREGFERSVLECDLSPTDKPESMYSAMPQRRGAGPRQ